MKTTPDKIGKWIDSQPEFRGLSHIEAMKRLLEKHKTPFVVGCQIPVYEHAVRRWIKARGWEYINGRWVAPQMESEIAS